MNVMSIDVYNMAAVMGGVSKTLNSVATDTDHIPVVCYAIEGNVVDRVSRKNGKGWCENVPPTLNTQDKHAVIYGISRSALKGGMNAVGMPIEEGTQPAITANGCGAVCYDACGNGDGDIAFADDSAFFQNTGRGWWNQSDIAQTLRTPIGGVSMKANLVMTRKKQ